jgi:hypothetical protein
VEPRVVAQQDGREGSGGRGKKLNASPARQFLFALAGHLKMTVRELGERMDSAELTEWKAYTTYFVPIENPWLQTGLVASIATAPYTPTGERPRTAIDFVPKLRAPQHESQDRAAVEQLARELGG